MNQQDAYLRRLSWRCRRGLLELDIVLARFIQTKYSLLSAEEQHIFNALLDVPDNELWDMITGKQLASDSTQQNLLLMLQTA